MSDNVIKLEISLQKIFFPKNANSVDSGSFAIFMAKVEKVLDGDYDKKKNKSIKLKGNVPTLNYGATYKLTCVLEESNEKYGDTYKILFMNKMIDLGDEYKQKEFLSTILTERQVEELFKTHGDNVISLLDEGNTEELCKVKGITAKKAKRILSIYNDAKDYSDILMELAKLNLTNTFIKKITDYYRNPETAIKVVRENPYKLIEIDGIGFKMADSIALKVGMDKFDIRRVGGYMVHYLQEQGEMGRSYVLYDELLKAVYDTLGFVPEEIMRRVAKVLVEQKTLIVSSDAQKIALNKYYKLETKLAKEIIRLAKGLNDNNNNEICDVDNECVSDVNMKTKLETYVPTLKFVDVEERLAEIERGQGFEFTEEQKQAILSIMDNNVVVLTGGAGCVDRDTEFFNGKQWKKICDYENGDKVLQFNEDRTSTLVDPIRYIKEPCDTMFHFETMYGLDQTLTDNHRVVYETSKGNINVKQFREVKEMHEESKHGFSGKFITTFDYNNDTVFPLTDDEIRVMVAVIADGSFYSNYENVENKCRMHIKKERKQLRLEELLKNANIEFVKHKSQTDGYYDYYFKAPRKEKVFTEEWYNCNKHQREVIADEVLLWDGSVNGKRRRFSTTIKESADFVQFVFSSLGVRATIKTLDRRGREKVDKNTGKVYVTKSIEYEVNLSSRSNLISMGHFHNVENKTKIEEVATVDGYKYCFTVPSSMLVLRRNGKIFITGNSGKSSTANGIVNLFDNANIVACALSGKASVRLKEATGLNATTIHRALGYGGGGFEYNKNNKMPCDVVVIDEATMINGSLFLCLLEAIPTGAKVIILGDIQQLTPIGNCQVFNDLLTCGVIKTVKLTKPHRQALRSGIIPLSIEIANNRPIFNNKFTGKQTLGELQDMFLDVHNKDCDLVQLVVEKFKEEMEIYKDVMKVQVCVPMRLRGSLSCFNLNNMIQEVYNPKNEFVDNEDCIRILMEKGTDEDDRREYVLRVNDKVVNTVNNYNTISTNGVKTPIYNGNIGCITSIGSDGIVTIDFEGIGEVILDKNESKNLELAYAMTTHKLQGSGFDSVIVAMDGSSFIMNNAEQLYTAITRAKKRCTLVGDTTAIRKAILTKEVNKKQTFLCDFLNYLFNEEDK